jgi:hypothetical protein
LGGGRGSSPSEADQTLEIMMSDLDPEVMKIFTKQFSANAAEATQVFFHLIMFQCSVVLLILFWKIF